MRNRTAGLTAHYHECKAVTRHYARTFYFASHVLPRDKRFAAYALYSFCRAADQIVDGDTSDAVLARARLNDLRSQIRSMVAGPTPVDPQFLALHDTVSRYGIPEHLLLDLIRGVEMDLSSPRFESFKQLREYCHLVASVVGLAMAKVFGVSEQRALLYAEHLGIAMQLTNILRDIGEDARRGRVYLPLEDLQRFGVTEAELRRGIVTERFLQLMQFQITRARMFYRLAERGIPMLTNDGSRFCVRLMSRSYARILDAIERNNYDVFHRRAAVPLMRKIIIGVTTAITATWKPADLKIRHAQQTAEAR
jgi:phytoene synthase